LKRNHSEEAIVRLTISLSPLTRASLAGLGVGIIGLLLQWAADPGKFGGAQKTFGMSFPPGILFILGFGTMTVLTSRWRWHPIFAVLISFWIVAVGGLAGKLMPNLTSSNLGTVLGNVVMCLGLIGAFVAGTWAMVQTGRRPAAAR
jgi:uncharacterized membrane protein YeaQ/YmgE (transglycosylase-associated protein family)